SSKFRARFIGQLADFDRQEAFLADFTTVSGRVGYRQKSTHDILVKFYSGLSVIFNSFGIDGFLDYGGQFGYQSSRFEILAGVTGRVLVTIGDPGDPNVTQIAVSGAVTLDRWRPGLVFRLPLDDDLDPMDFVIGLKLGVVLK
ncbi:hypothetical protein GWO14_18645, partial [candidate division KSB1 bacterium]|nr:hypothetical protein [candidate division KSB1 bacterium]